MSNNFEYNIYEERKAIQNNYFADAKKYYIRIAIGIFITVVSLVVALFTDGLTCATAFAGAYYAAFFAIRLHRLRVECDKDIQKALDNKKRYYKDKREREPSDTEWRCQKCGTINANFVGTCGCGNTKQG